jgi:tellurite resistance protein TerC
MRLGRRARRRAVTQLGLWILFSLVILVMLAVDLGVLNRRAHVVTTREAARWSVVVIASAAAFNAWLFLTRGSEAGLQFTAGYLIELALSVDNVFVFILIFSYFRVPPAYHHRVLFWGIFGALLMRGAMIAAGWLMIEHFHWITYVFGAFLVITGIRMAVHQDIQIEPEANPVLKLVRRFLPVSASYDGERFFTKHRDAAGRLRLVATPLFLVLLMVETTDLVFAVDSIPAIFAVTLDPFIVFTSNVFAILGLRSMYFLIGGVMDKFHYLKLGLALVLSFVGVKMLVVFFHIEIPIVISLLVVASTLGLSMLASLVIPRKDSQPVAEKQPEQSDSRARRSLPDRTRRKRRQHGGI